MSALAEKIKSLMDSNNFEKELTEILLELEARQPNYTIQMFPNPRPFPPAGTVYPFSPNPVYPYNTFPRIGEPTAICHNANSNGPVPLSDPTGYVESSDFGSLKLVGDGTPKNPAIAVRIPLKRDVGYGG